MQFEITHGARTAHGGTGPWRLERAIPGYANLVQKAAQADYIFPYFIVFGDVRVWGLGRVSSDGQFSSDELRGTLISGVETSVRNGDVPQPVELALGAAVYDYDFEDISRFTTNLQEIEAAAISAGEDITAKHSEVTDAHTDVTNKQVQVAAAHTAAIQDAAEIASAKTTTEVAVQNILAGRAGEHLGVNSLNDPLYQTDYSIVTGVASADGEPGREKRIPTGGLRLESASQSNIELVSSMWYGLEAPRLPANTQVPLEDDPWLATPSNPFNRFNGVVGARLKEGGMRGRYFNGDSGLWGLNDAWAGASSEGHILKITTPNVAAEAGNSLWLGFGNEAANEFIQKYQFSAWIYVKSGGLAFGNHAGFNGVQGTVKITAADCAKGVADHPFQFVSLELSGWYSGNSPYRSINLTPLFGMENEIYIGLPSLIPLRGTQSIPRGR